MAVPPTLIDEAEALPERAQRGRKSSGLWGILGALVVILGVAGGAMYWMLLRYEPTAHRHVPAGSSMAARIDFQEIALFGPVRRQIWPLLTEGEGQNVPASAEKSLPERLEAETGLKLGRDIREVVLATVGKTDSGRWIAVLGGKVPSGVVKKLAHGLAAEEGVKGWEYSLAEDVLTWRTLGIAVGQAKDRSIIIASDAATLAAALPEQDGARAMGLPETGALTFAVAPSAWNEWGSGMAATFVPGLRTLGKLQGCNGRFALGSSPELEMQCRLPQGVDANQIRGSLVSLTTTLRGMLELASGPDVMGERQVLAGLKIDALADGRIRLLAPWPADGLERGLQTLAQKIRAARMLTGKP